MEEPIITRQKYNPETKTEIVGFLVPDEVMMAFKYMIRYPDTKQVLPRWACYIIGRKFDLYRCEGCGVKVHDNGDVEIRLKFGLPWYERTDGAGNPAIKPRDVSQVS